MLYGNRKMLGPKKEMSQKLSGHIYQFYEKAIRMWDR